MPATNRCLNEESWSVLLRDQFQVIPPCRVRHEPGFDWQLYLQSCTPAAPNNALVAIAQAVTSDNRKSVRTHPIFGKTVLWDDLDIDAQFCIDEVARKLYLFYQGITNERPGEKCFQLSSVGISFGPPDRFGHRRVTVRQGGGNTYKINFGHLVITEPNFFLHPKTGELFFQAYDGGDVNYIVNGKMDLNSAHGSMDYAKLLGKVYTGNTIADINGHRFSQNGKRLAVFNSSTFFHSDTPGPNMNDKRSVVHWYSIDGEFRLERELTFDHFTMFKKLYPQYLMGALKLLRFNYVIKLVSQTTIFCGHSFKYTLLSNALGVFAVKHFDRWVTDDLGQSKTRRVFMSLDTQDLWLAVRSNPEIIKKHLVLGSVFYYPAVDNKRGEQHLHRLELGDDLKDYRTCAYCGIEETGKRRNAKGKRIAQFKVCGECKKLKLHHQWWQFPCHFCSKECVKKGWKEHKKQHKPYYSQHPFMWMLVAVVMLLLLRLVL